MKICPPALILLLSIWGATAQDPLPLPFGAAANDTFTPDNDDGSSVEFTLLEPLRFFGETVSQVYQNTNGDITFDAPYGAFQPSLVPSINIPPLVAIYWTDIDTRDYSDVDGGGALWARTTNDVADLVTIANLVQGTGSFFNPTSAFVATWDEVKPYGVGLRPTPNKNTFQLIIAMNDVESWAILAYTQLEWFAASTSPNSVIGFNDRQGLQGELIKNVDSVEDMQILLNETNCNVPGVFAYQISEEINLGGCGVLEASASISPFFGVEAGGTLIRISNLPECLDDPSIDIYCRFQGDDVELVSSGFRGSRELVECLSPFAGRQVAVDVAYAVHDPTGGAFDAAEAAWVDLERQFQYFGERVGVILNDDPESGLVSAGEDILVGWSKDALLAAALISFYGVNPASETLSGIMVDVEVLCFEPDRNPVLVQTTTLSAADLNETTLVIEDSNITPFLLQWGDTGDFAALALVRVVAYVGVDRRILSARSSAVFAVLPEGFLTGRRRLQGGGTCPMRSRAECPNIDGAPPCPPTYQNPEIDGFTDDGFCAWPSGNELCIPKFDIDIDAVTQCGNLGTLFGGGFGPGLIICIDVPIGIGIDFDIGISGCGCSSFHDGATGCTRNGSSQCCYAASGGLLTDPQQGAGTADCFPSTDLIRHFLHDVIPFIYCCNLLGSDSAACADYYEQRPPITDEGYQPPTPPAVFYGDPHVRTLDGVRYNFNGAGEYVALCGILGDQTALQVSELLAVCDPSVVRLGGRDVLSVNFRFAPLGPTDRGTVTVGVGIEDPSHNDGQTALVVVSNPERRIDVYLGSDRVAFPVPTIGQDIVRVTLSDGTMISKTSDLTATVVTVEVVMPSGLNLRVGETGGVLLPSIIAPRSLAAGRSIGLLGRADGDAEGDLVSSTGNVPDVSSLSEEEREEVLFSEFGQSWMILVNAGSLFQSFAGSSLSFDIFHNPFFVPLFAAPPLGPLQAQADEACGSIVDATIRAGCYFDISITGDVDLFGAIAESAVTEEQERLFTLTNSIPEIEGSLNRAITVGLGVSTSFSIVASDADGDTLSASLDRNDAGLFSVGAGQSPGTFTLAFAATPSEGTFIGQVSIADGLGSRLFAAIVTVSASAPAPTPMPAGAPGCSGFFCKKKRGLRLRNLKEVETRRLIEFNGDECSGMDYDMYLVAEGAHFAGLATSIGDRGDCPAFVFHAVPTESGGTMTKIALSTTRENVAELDNDAKLHLGTRPFVEIVNAFETAPVGKKGIVYDIVSNNCVALLRNMADPLGILVDDHLVNFVSRKLLDDSNNHILEMMRSSPVLSTLTGGGGRLLRGWSNEDLLSKVVKLYL